jgi:hypothetical protein
LFCGVFEQAKRFTVYVAKPGQFAVVKRGIEIEGSSGSYTALLSVSGKV